MQPGFAFLARESGNNFLTRDTRKKVPTCNWHFAKISSPGLQCWPESGTGLFGLAFGNQGQNFL